MALAADRHSDACGAHRARGLTGGETVEGGEEGEKVKRNITAAAPSSTSSTFSPSSPPSPPLLVLALFTPVGERGRLDPFHFRPSLKTKPPMPIIKFIKENKEIEVPEGANLRQEAIKAGINVHQGLNGFGASINKHLNCHGFGQCGTCRVNIVKGIENTNEMGMVEKLRFKCPIPTPVTPGGFDPLPCLAYVGNEAQMRLSCKTQVYGDVEVETGPEVDLFGENFFS